MALKDSSVDLWFHMRDVHNWSEPEIREMQSKHPHLTLSRLHAVEHSGDAFFHDVADRRYGSEFSAQERV